MPKEKAGLQGFLSDIPRGISFLGALCSLGLAAVAGYSIGGKAPGKPIIILSVFDFTGYAIFGKIHVKFSGIRAHICTVKILSVKWSASC